MTEQAAAPSVQYLRRRTAQPHRTSLADSVGSSATTKNVVVLGGSYGGMHAATVLANRLPPSHRVILIERNSHFNHLYVFPRFSTLPGHEHKAFIPYTSIFKDAPRRPRSTAKPVAGPSYSHTPSPQDKDTSTYSRTPTESSPSEQMLGMGSVSGNILRNKDSTTSDSSSDSRFQRSRFGSSDSRSSSLDDTSLFEDRLNDHLRVNSVADTSSASSAASSYRSASFEKPNSSDKQVDRAAKLAAPAGVEQALPEEGAASRAEERLGRPEIEVEELSEAIDKGISLDDGHAVATTEGGEVDVAQGFEDASPHVVLQADVSSITPTHVVVQSVDQPSNHKDRLWSIDSVSIAYSHLVYALGSHLPDPLRTEARTKEEGVSWMQEMQARVKDSHEIVLVGGGALGVEYATDIKSVYPGKSVTLIHSRKQLLPNFDVQVHDVALQRLQQLGVKVVLGERLALTEGCPRGSTVQQQKEAASASSHPDRCASADRRGEGEQARNEGMCLGNGRKRVKTTGGKEFECDLLLLCTGQQPNSELMAQLSPTSVDASTRLVRVLRTLQVKVPDPHGSLAQMPFDARPPCGDCDCFLDKKAAGANDGVEGSKLDGVPGGDSKLPNVYAIGDVADAFGALNAGYQAWAMADVAAENIVRDIQNGQNAATTADKVALQHFDPAANLLKLSLGLGKMVFQGPPDEKTGVPLIEVREDPDDLTVEGVWTFMAGVSTDDMHA